MPVSVKVKIIGEDKVTAVIDGMAERSNDLSKPLKRGRQIMLSSIQKNFRDSGRPNPWKPLSISTIKNKLRNFYSLKPLIRTGVLSRSITGLEEKNRLVIGTAVEYAPYHQRGTRKIPKRPFLVFQDKDIDRISRLVVDYISGKD